MKILIKVPESLSEMILFSPVLRVIKEKIKEAHITIIVTKFGRDVFSNDPFVDDVWTLEKDGFEWKHFLLLSRKWKNQKFTHYLYFGGSQTASHLAWFKRVPVRAGRINGLRSQLLLNHGQNQTRLFTEMHETEYNLNLLRPLGINYSAHERAYLETKIHIDNVSAKKSFERFTKELIKEGIELNSEIFFLHPIAKGLHPIWASRNFAKLIEKVEAKYPDRFTFVVSYKKGDEKLLSGFHKQIDRQKNNKLKGKIYYFDGLSQGLRYYIEVLNHAKLFIAHNMGVYYCANALGIKTIGLYLPLKSVSAFRWAPFHLDDSRSTVVIPEVVCGEVEKCIGEKCPYYECMGRIEVENIMSYVEEYISEGKVSKKGLR